MENQQHTAQPYVSSFSALHWTADPFPVTHSEALLPISPPTACAVYCHHWIYPFTVAGHGSWWFMKHVVQVAVRGRRQLGHCGGGVGSREWQLMVGKLLKNFREWHLRQPALQLSCQPFLYHKALFI